VARKYLSDLSSSIRRGAGGDEMELDVGPVLGPVHELGVDPGQALYKPTQIFIRKHNFL
jgi:hypothetical protein